MFSSVSSSGYSGKLFFSKKKLEALLFWMRLFLWSRNGDERKKWNKVEQSGTKWNKVEQRGTKGNKGEQRGTKGNKGAKGGKGGQRERDIR